ncbi:MAG TPA: MFS transporter [Candidatus Acidoferrales bacterium]|nr:MFS transporter [Candidatus Acidoferrales bacterium]
MRWLVARASLWDPGLPRTVWIQQVGVFVNFFGNGLVFPFLVLYLHYVRGLEVGVAAATVASGGLVAIVSGFAAGWLADRIGPKRVLVFAMLSNAVAYTLYLFVSEAWQALAVAWLVGIGTGSYGPSSQSLLSAMVPPDRRHRVFAQNRLTSLVGLGLGGLVGGLIAAGGSAMDYDFLLILDVVTFTAFAFVIAALDAPAHGQVAGTSHGGYRDVLRDRTLRWIVLINVALVAGGIAPISRLAPIFLKTHAATSESAIGAIYALNTITVLLAQVPLAGMVEGRRRMPVLGVGALLWCGAWLLFFAAAASGDAVVSALVAAPAIVLYSLGENLYALIVTPTVASVAPDALRGRYLAVLGLSWQGGFVLGPSIGGQLVVLDPWVLPAFGICGTAVALVLALRLDRALPAAHRETPRTDRRAA